MASVSQIAVPSSTRTGTSPVSPPRAFTCIRECGMYRSMLFAVNGAFTKSQQQPDAHRPRRVVLVTDDERIVHSCLTSQDYSKILLPYDPATAEIDNDVPKANVCSLAPSQLGHSCLQIRTHVRFDDSHIVSWTKPRFGGLFSGEPKE